MRRHIFLYGPPGTGKTTVGRLLAEQLDLAFVDLDQVIESGAGASISQIVKQSGEPEFRGLERGALEQVSRGAPSVIALGGGALLQDDNRALAERSGEVVCMLAGLQTLLARLQNDGGARPLLAGDLNEKLVSLLARREEHYRSFPLRVQTELPPDETSWQIRVALGRFRLRAMGEYDVLVREGGIQDLGELLATRALLRPVLVTDENVRPHHAEPALAALRGAALEAPVLTLPAGESHKTLDSVGSLWRGFLEAGLDRGSTVVALGGGVIGDLAGFAAATYMRGVNWVVVPTTLLSMVDAAIGGKTGFDLPEGKNLIGAFHAPRLVLADPRSLSTLPEDEYRAGLAEVVKHGIIADPALFELCGGGVESVRERVDEVVRRALAVKVRVVESDPFERGPRAALNLGHTVGHAVELASGFRLRHGQAVAIGLVVEAELAERLTLAAPGLADEIAGVLSGLGLPVRIPPELSRAEILRAMRVDKKKSGSAIRFALPAEIGKVQVGIQVDDLEQVFREA